MQEHFVVEPGVKYPVTGLFETRTPEYCREFLFCFVSVLTLLFLSLSTSTSLYPMLCWIPPPLYLSDFSFFCFAFLLFQRILASSEVENWEFISLEIL